MHAHGAYMRPPPSNYMSGSHHQLIQEQLDAAELRCKFIQTELTRTTGERDMIRLTVFLSNNLFR